MAILLKGLEITAIGYEDPQIFIEKIYFNSIFCFCLSKMLAAIQETAQNEIEKRKSSEFREAPCAHFFQGLEKGSPFSFPPKYSVISFPCMAAQVFMD